MPSIVKECASRSMPDRTPQDGQQTRLRARRLRAVPRKAMVLGGAPLVARTLLQQQQGREEEGEASSITAASKSGYAAAPAAAAAAAAPSAAVATASPDAKAKSSK